MRVLKTCTFHLPTEIHAQARVAAYLDVADEAIFVTQRMIVAFAQEKRALMAQLLTGKRRVRSDAVVAGVSA